MKERIMKFEKPHVLARLDAIVAVTTDRAMTQRQIAVAVGVASPTVWCYLERLRRQRRLYVHSWHRGEGRCGKYMASYRAGNADDAPKPRPLADNVRCKKFRIKQKAKQPRRDPFTAAFFGSASP
jgi:hypothetical protein